MSGHLWEQRPPAALGPDVAHVARWQPVSLADVTHERRQLAAALHDGARPSGATEGAVERLLLAFEELASNALRHGGGPVEVTVTAGDGCWLLEVRDTATERPPTPAVGRDAAQGGLGLYLVARISADHGWTVDGDYKMAWARLDYTRSEAPPAPAALPHPREPLAGDSHSH